VSAERTVFDTSSILCTVCVVCLWWQSKSRCWQWCHNQRSFLPKGNDGDCTYFCLAHGSCSLARPNKVWSRKVRKSELCMQHICTVLFYSLQLHFVRKDAVQYNVIGDEKLTCLPNVTKTKQELCCHKETVWCSVFFPVPSDPSFVTCCGFQ